MTRYYRCERGWGMPPMLLRSTEGRLDESFRDGAWGRTLLVIEWMAGHADDVDPITEAEARALAPAAF